MKKKYKDIESLLDQNSADQLSKVDWDQLHSDIQQRLDHAHVVCDSRLALKTILKWAISLSSAAAVIMAVFIFTYDNSKDIQLASGQRAAVKLIDSATAKVSITQSNHAKYVSVSIQPSAREAQVRLDQKQSKVAQCNVRLIDPNGHAEKEKNKRSSWVIIIASKPERFENEQEQADIACLL